MWWASQALSSGMGRLNGAALWGLCPARAEANKLTHDHFRQCLSRWALGGKTSSSAASGLGVCAEKLFLVWSSEVTNMLTALWGETACLSVSVVTSRGTGSTLRMSWLLSCVRECLGQRGRNAWLLVEIQPKTLWGQVPIALLSHLRSVSNEVIFNHPGVIVPPWRHLAMSAHFCCHKQGYLVIEARDSAKHPKRHGIAPHNKESSGPSC